MKDRNTAQSKLDTLCGKTVMVAEAHFAHGEVIELTFDDGTRLHVCSTYGLQDKTIKPDTNDIYVSLNGEAL